MPDAFRPPPDGVRKTVLPNGLRILSETIPQFSSVTIGIWVQVGSRYESAEQSGISHFLEHLFFKGTERRTAKQIAQEIDAVGGVLNAFTDREYTCYHAKVLREDLPLAFDVLSDVFLHARFPEDEIERERTVVLSEISEGEDRPLRPPPLRSGILAGRCPGAPDHRQCGDGFELSAAGLRPLRRAAIPA